jgi:3-phosphoshikimate 1-carboxyvinyltransferase
MLSQFGVRYEKSGNEYRVFAGKYALERYAIEPDFSAAGYFFAAGALLGRKTTVKGLHRNAMQGDRKFLDVLSGMGATIEENEGGISVCGNGQLHGIEVNMNDFSDQALTLAAIAPFADSPTTITGIGHIRKQECDRIYAMETNLAAMGVRTKTWADGITVYPCNEIQKATIQTFGDHRVAMSFAVAGLRCGDLTIEDSACCKKTFENFFDEIEKLYYN